MKLCDGQQDDNGSKLEQQSIGKSTNVSVYGGVGANRHKRRSITPSAVPRFTCRNIDF
jgi:hypothetical protein